ncbi:MAG: NAD-dependent epimerase/dehydratase family protein, partial [bacterium]|nr:NAD-dependent epimerase/dehydratase family protein [bacterium]
MHILVSGGAGFIGSHLVEYHLNRGDSVLAIDDLSTGSLKNIEPFFENKNFRFEEANILTWNNIEDMVGWADRIYHMAAVVGMFRVLKEPINVLAVNIAGTERLLRAAHANKWGPEILIASSASVYGNRFGSQRPGAPARVVSPSAVDASTLPPCNEGDVELSEDMELTISANMGAHNNYSLSKLVNELFAISYARQFDLNVRCVRLFNIVGPRQTGEFGRVVPRFVRQAVEGRPINVFGDGSQTRCFTDVRDAVRAMDLLGGCFESKGEVVNVGSRNEVSIHTLARMVQDQSPMATGITFTPYKEAYGEHIDEIYHRRPSLKKLESLIPFRCEWTLKDT